MTSYNAQPTARSVEGAPRGRARRGDPTPIQVPARAGGPLFPRFAAPASKGLHECGPRTAEPRYIIHEHMPHPAISSSLSSLYIVLSNKTKRQSRPKHGIGPRSMPMRRRKFKVGVPPSCSAWIVAVGERPDAGNAGGRTGAEKSKRRIERLSPNSSTCLPTCLFTHLLSIHALACASIATAVSMDTDFKCLMVA